MSVKRIAGRYAKSLLELAQEQHKLERVTEDVQSFQQAMGNRDLYLLFKSPIVNASKKTAIVNQLFQGKYDELTLAFLRILITKGREGYLPEIAAEYMDQYKHLMHITTVKVTTAQPISPASLESLRKQLQTSKATDEKVEIVTAVDPELIGGFVLEFDDNIYDASIAYKLDKLRRDFQGNTYESKVEKK
ncbi:MAG: ATP synthase F1 subunit delta [Lewinella sp.]|nr:ATP synthase F1 subunit delta [Lewinella sp.]